MGTGGGADHFPVWGTCMGFQLMALAVSGDAALLARFNGSDYASHIALTPASSTSRMLGEKPIHLNLTFHHSEPGIPSW